MDTKEFLDLVLPSDDEGFRALRIQTPYERQECARTNDGAMLKAIEWANRGANVFFCIASQTDELIQIDVNGKKKTKFRSQANAHSVRILFLDLDVAKPDEIGSLKFTTRADAINALKDFCKVNNLPRPLMVASGMYGVHVYWPFETAVPVARWKPVALKFKELCIASGFNIDAAVPADSARVLRVVGTWNFKHGKEKTEDNLVRVLGDYVPPALAFEDYEMLINAACDTRGVTCTTTPTLFDSGNTDANDAFDEVNTERKQDDTPVSLAKIVEQCPALADTVVDHGARDNEPVWYAVTGLATWCDDVEAATAELSSGGKDYVLEDSLAKGQQWRQGFGPVSCGKLREARHSCGLTNVCETCPHWGKITSPIQLGKYVAELIYTAEEIADDVLTEQVNLHSNPPFPYARSATGQIIVKTSDKNGVEKPVVICEYDFFPRLLLDNEKGEDRHVTWRYKQPRGAPKDLMVPQTLIQSDPSRLASFLGGHGITISPKHNPLMQDYMTAYIKQILADTDTGLRYTTLGWKHDSFVVPTGVYTPMGLREFTYDAGFQQDLPGMGQTAGTLDAWKELMGFYNQPGYEAFQLAFLMLIGSPLLKFTNVMGLVVSLCGESGAGKSTVLKLANSMYGHPELMMLNGTKNGATINALFRQIALYQNIHVGLDEISNMEKDKASDLVYSTSIGVGKTRVKQDGMSIRERQTFQLILGTTTNQSLRAKLSANKIESYAEQMRVIEFRVQNAKCHTKSQADAMIRKMMSNYGHAGAPFITYLVANQAQINEAIQVAMETIDTEWAVQASERFWSAGIACALITGKILKNLGYLNWSLPAIRNFAKDHLQASRLSLNDDLLTPEATISHLMEEFGPHTIVVNSDIGRGNMNQRPLFVPHIELWGRYERDIGVLYMSREAIKKLCHEHTIDMFQLQRYLREAKILTDHQSKRTLGAGTDHSLARLNCWKIDMNHPALSGVPREVLFNVPQEKKVVNDE